MRKVAIVALLLAGSALAASYPTWMLVGESPGNYKAYVLSTLIGGAVLPNGNRIGWTLLDFDHPMDTFRDQSVTPYRSLRAFVEFDCVHGAYRPMYTEPFERLQAEGKPITHWSVDPNNEMFYAVSPKTVWSLWFHAACDT